LELGLPDVVDALHLVKTRQFPENEINADEGQNDSNWQVLERAFSIRAVFLLKLWRRVWINTW